MLRALAGQFKSVSTVWIGMRYVTSAVYLPTNCVRDALNHTLVKLYKLLTLDFSPNNATVLQLTFNRLIK